MTGHPMSAGTQGTELSTALSQLRTAFVAGSWAGALEFTDATVGYVGADVPAEAIHAAQLSPARLVVPDHPATQPYLEDTVEPWLRAILAQLLDPDVGQPRRLVIANEGDGSRRLYYYIRELQAIGRLSNDLQVHFLDLVRNPGDAEREYNRRQLERLVDVLGAWAGGRVTEDDLRVAIDRAELRREVLRRVCTRRLGARPRVGGADVLAIIGAAGCLPPCLYDLLIDDLDADPMSAWTGDSVAVFVSGSPLDRPELYDAIAAAGGRVVGEDHDWGEPCINYAVKGSDGARDALIDRWFNRLGGSGIARSVHERARHSLDSAAACGAAGVVCAITAGDPSPAWDVPSQLAEFSAAGLPAVVLRGLPYRGPLSAEIPGQLSTLIQRTIPAANREDVA